MGLGDCDGLDVGDCDWLGDSLCDGLSVGLCDAVCVSVSVCVGLWLCVRDELNDWLVDWDWLDVPVRL